MKTPDIPEAIRQLPPPPGFENPFRLGLAHTRLFGTETLCGDWSGDLLLLAQDFAPAERALAVAEKFGPEAAWRHNDGDGRYNIGLETNRTICRLLALAGKTVDINGGRALDCGVLYGNACFFLKHEATSSVRRGTRASLPVLRFVVDRMARLRTIACLGQQSFDAVMSWLGRPHSWRAQLDAGEPVEFAGLTIWALSHPGRLGTNGRLSSATHLERVRAIEDDWRRLGRKT